MESTDVFFRVSSGLKNILGRDLITNDFVAVFELVKNSYDARAKNVWLIFRDDSIFVADDGKGMSRVDIEQKWLFVAYSAKQDGSEDENLPSDYRTDLSSRTFFAGNKGVGRFSCDRLGSRLRLQSRPSGPGASTNTLEIDWDVFEESLRKEFVSIPGKLAEGEELDVPIEIRELKQGTILEISGLREQWPREKLLQLRRHLEKLINPFETRPSDFRISLVCDREQPHDQKVLEKHSASADQAESASGPPIVNGPVENLIFTELAGRTTYIRVYFDADTGELLSELVDRGEEIYVTREPHNFPLLAEAKFSCNLFYLNRAAKNTFARRMGISSVEFGSVFLFKNNFRIFPIGDEGDDTFGINRRKQQGYARYLGTRDVVGRIDIFGAGRDFKESTSRDHGLIRNAAFNELEECFLNVCFRRLESYVVDVTWPDKPDKDREDISRLLSDAGKTRVVQLLRDLTGNEAVKLVKYSDRLVSLVNERSESFEQVAENLRRIASTTGNSSLVDQVDRAHARYQALKQSEAVARETAERERTERLAAESAAAIEREARLRIEGEIGRLQVEVEEERKRKLFLSATGNLDRDTIVNLHHQIVIYASEMQAILELLAGLVRDPKPLPKDDVLTYTDALAFHTSKVLAVSKLATRANFRVEADVIEADLVQYMQDYVQNVASLYSRLSLTFTVPGDVTLRRSFRPIEISMLVDNLISNSDRAGATSLEFIAGNDRGQIAVRAADNGRGLQGSLKKEPDRAFEKGYSTTTGSGLGLFHVQQIVESLGGSVSIDTNIEEGFCLLISIPRPQ